jgi:glycosyltransferase involved in cell wall biosynthesis
MYFKGQAFEVHIGGVGSESDEVWAREFISSRNLAQQVVLHGRVDTPRFLADKHVLVAPSRARETFNMAVLEAAACAMPSIVADRGALPERVLHGRSGWVFPVGDAAALAQAILHCMANPAEVRAKASLALALAEESRTTDETGMWEQFCARVLNQTQERVAA